MSSKIIAIRPGGVIIFNSINECCKGFCLSYRRLLELIESGESCNGYTFDYLEDGSDESREYSGIRR